MDEPPNVLLVTPGKRSLEDEVDAPVSTPDNAALSNTSTPLTVLSTMASPSPMKAEPSYASASGSSNGSVTGDAATSTHKAAASGGAQPPAKRRKLTMREKEEKKLEKEVKEKAKAEKKAQKDQEDKLKAEQKAQKDEEKRVKDEEKRKKNEEKEGKKKAKEFELQRKEEEKRKKEEEKLKKERSQPRLNAFFVKPKSNAESSGSVPVDVIQNPTIHPVSLAPDVPLQDTNSTPASPQKIAIRKAQSDYDRYFLPFSLPSHAILAPYNRFMEDPANLAKASARLDELVSGTKSTAPVTLETLKESFSASGPRGLKTVPILEIVELVNGSSDKPIDLTNDRDPLHLLKQIPMKYLHFPRDVRPPYYGTYTKPHTHHEELKLARNPFSRTLRDCNYDYDSEAEWDEPEEGEDLDSEGDDDLDDEVEDEFDGFLDDDEDPQLKRRHISGDLEPISTGLCWEDAHGVSRLNDGSGAISTEFKEFEMGFLLEPYPQSIDPFSTAYWTPDPTPASKTIAAVATKETKNNGSMNPPRFPLTQRPVNGMLNTLNPPNDKTASPSSKQAKPPKRQIPPEHLPAFKAEVEGSDLTKLALVESLKKKFPKLPKDAISNTLSTVAARLGAKEVEKRWVLI